MEAAQPAGPRRRRRDRRRWPSRLMMLLGGGVERRHGRRVGDHVAQLGVAVLA